ncbi:MAG TPA: SHOCT domain-containing protein [Streptosporangiaceae bacterium]
MFVRRRPLMRAAVVGGGAYVAGRSMGRRADQQQQAEAEQDQRISDLEQQQAPPAPVEQAPAAAATSPMIDQLNQLATLHQQGILSDEEFTAAKAKLFGT